MLPVMGMSKFLNNTPVVAMFCAGGGRVVPAPPFVSVKLMPPPLSYAAIFGGCCTLIGTSTNLIVHGLVLGVGQTSAPWNGSTSRLWECRWR